MNYKNNIRSRIQSGKLSTRILKAKEKQQLLDEVNRSKPLTLMGIRQLALVCRHAGEAHDEELLHAIRDHVGLQGHITVDIITIIQGLFRPTRRGAEKITRALADFLFDLNEVVADSEHNHDSWGPFFSKMVSKHLLEDSEKPNEINEEEANWLIERVLSDGQYDYVEQVLLPMLDERAKKMPETLKFQIELLNGTMA